MTIEEIILVKLRDLPPGKKLEGLDFVESMKHKKSLIHECVTGQRRITDEVLPILRTEKRLV